MLRPLLLLVSILFLSAPLLAQENASYPPSSEQPITSRERIVFTSYYEDREQQRDIYIFDPESENMCLLLANMRGVHFDWSPDGNTIVFNELSADDTGRIYVDRLYTIRANATELLQQTELGLGVRGVTWSPDGNLIAYEQQVPEISIGSMITIREGFQGDVIAQYANPYRSGYFPMGSPVWSPNGDRVAFPGSFVDMSFTLAQPTTQIYTLSTNGDTVFGFTGTSGNDYSPTWSPDGHYLAFISRENDERHLMIANAETGRADESPIDIAANIALWLADGRLAFTSKDGDSYSLFVTDASMTGNWTTFERVPLPFNIVQFDWWIDPATIETPETS